MNSDDVISTTILPQPETTTITTTVDDFNSFIEDREHWADTVKILNDALGKQRIIKTKSSDDNVSTNIPPPPLPLGNNLVAVVGATSFKMTNAIDTNMKTNNDDDVVSTTILPQLVTIPTQLI